MINLQFFKVIKNHIINTLYQFYNEWKDSDLEIWINLCCISRVYIESLFGAKDLYLHRVETFASMLILSKHILF